jgi:hypothetical protein
MKLDDRSQTMILIGYHQTGAYKLLDESKEWNWGQRVCIP